MWKQASDLGGGCSNYRETLAGFKYGKRDGEIWAQISDLKSM